MTRLTEWREVLDHYTRDHRERTGREPARPTLKEKAVKLGRACDLLSLPPGDAEGLAEALADAGAVADLFDLLRGEGTSSGTLRVYLDALTTFGRYCEDVGLPVPNLSVRRPHANAKPQIEVFTPDQLYAMVKRADEYGVHYAGALALLAWTGRRANEVVTLKWADLDLGAEPPRFTLTHTKNHSAQVVGIPSQALPWFTPDRVAAMKAGGTLRRPGGDPQVEVFPLSYGQLRITFGRVQVQEGLRPRGLHHLRHTVCTHLLSQGVSPVIVAALVGNSPAVLLDRYSHVVGLPHVSLLEGL